MRKPEVCTEILLLLLVISALSPGIVFPDDAPEGEMFMLVYKRGMPLEDMSFRGHNVLADYESFLLVETSEEGRKELLAQGHVIESLDDGDLVSLRSHTFYTGEGEPEIPRELSIYDPSGRGYYILQFVGPIKVDW
ncbi:MAG: hypothetical protein R6U17_09005 [Thermoplasmata archaeon]